MSSEYRALVSKVEAFTEASSQRRQADMACRTGCDGCCHAWLTVSAVEAAALREAIAALPPAERDQIAEQGKRELAREAAGEKPARCALLSEDGRCAAYARRPLVCRTQGHALRYPAGIVPLEAVRGRAGTGEVTFCPLNFTRALPGPEDVLDAELVDRLLAVVNHRFALAEGTDPGMRHPISELAARADMLACAGAALHE